MRNPNFSGVETQSSILIGYGDIYELDAFNHAFMLENPAKSVNSVFIAIVLANIVSI